VAAKRKVAKKTAKTAKKAVKKASAKKAPAKKASAKKAAAKKPAAKKAPVAKVPAKKKPAKRTNHHVGAATTAAILGLPASPAKRAAQKRKEAKLNNGGKWAKQMQLLINLRDRLTDQRNGLAKESAKEMESYGVHMADSGTDNFDRDFNLSLLSSDQDVIYEIEEALKRIEKDTYGVCEITGKPIPQTRLNAIPWTRFRVDAQSELEQYGILQNRSLGRLGTITTQGSSTKDKADKELPEPKSKKS
jgi:RNA polymerase-binding transcription factor DksA